MDIVDKALLFATSAHGGQKYGHLPYAYHLVETVKVAKELNFDIDIQVACALHDVLEDTPLSYNDVADIFGTHVADIVYDVTDELGKNRDERHIRTYPKIAGNIYAILVKFCDKIANVRHSKEDSPAMLKMHKKEHLDFVNGIVLDESWENLQVLLAIEVLSYELR